MKTYAVQQKYNPSFQKLNIYELPNWNRKLLNAVWQSKGIKEAAQKHDITIYQNKLFGSYNIFVSNTALKNDDIFYIAGYKKYHDLSSAIKQIENFDAKQFDNFVNSKLRIKKMISQKIEEYNKKLEVFNQPEGKKNNSFIHKLLNFCK